MSAEPTTSVATHQAWSTYCQDGGCWVAASPTDAPGTYVMTRVRAAGTYETSVFQADPPLTDQDRVSLSVGTETYDFGQRSEGFAFPDPADNAVIMSSMRRGARGSVTINDESRDLSLMGYTSALRDAHTASDVPFDNALLDTPMTPIPQSDPAPAPAATPQTGCSDGDLDAEANRLIASFGPTPSVASETWRHGYNMMRALRRLMDEQARRCNRDMSAAKRFYDDQISGFERTGRAAGWL